ncbi:CvpA family protein [Terriglobus saanensis]|uniref:Colicin V production protein n=1 Tax=Terriglobus saanensis (strain ATCC BAA-1853 / DSM 23119 / SP1PR4) TaxID=401053 RepID=E8V061_TERSS|nr:CvpA family protein [Terriglobus saanensis]ADV83279.1 Colicin V production protein [Terriglobus saanensis SP1PR4]
MQTFLHHLNVLDWIFLGALLTSVVMGFLRGLVRSLCSLAGIVVGIVLAGWYAQKLSLPLGRWITPPLAAQVVAFLAISLGTMLLFALAGRIIRGTMQVVGLGFADRCAGALFGLLRGYLVVAATLLPLAGYLPQTDLAKRSFLLPSFLEGAHEISFVLPRNFMDRIAGSLLRLRQENHR